MLQGRSTSTKQGNSEPWRSGGGEGGEESPMKATTPVHNNSGGRVLDLGRLTVLRWFSFLMGRGEREGGGADTDK